VGNLGLAGLFCTLLGILIVLSLGIIITELQVIIVILRKVQKIRIKFLEDSKKIELPWHAKRKAQGEGELTKPGNSGKG
jgi:hypothetical protein